ncbi:restriction endonuclease [Thiohalobacter thiocyanaticus]|uniref:Restriction endonuclease n=1 Tax=Thiohalobacter thiocyanaticus TaxID=585455 RepID=A0A1Z4VMD1_9GAMM|nr:restriction endonuclease [Thiohalobacter thiocyanaticus]
MGLSRKTIRDIKKGLLPKYGHGYHFMPLVDYYDTTTWEGLRTAALKRDNGVCAECGTSINLQVHHVRYPESYFIGRDRYINIEADEIGNLVTLCEQHHSERHSHIIQNIHRGERVTYLYEEDMPQEEIDFRTVTFFGEDPSEEDGGV